MKRPQFDGCGQKVQCRTTVADTRDTTARERVRRLSIRPKEVQHRAKRSWQARSPLSRGILAHSIDGKADRKGIFGEGTERTESCNLVHYHAEAAPTSSEPVPDEYHGRSDETLERMNSLSHVNTP